MKRRVKEAIVYRGVIRHMCSVVIAGIYSILWTRQSFQCLFMRKHVKIKSFARFNLFLCLLILIVCTQVTDLNRVFAQLRCIIPCVTTKTFQNYAENSSTAAGPISNAYTLTVETDRPKSTLKSGILYIQRRTRKHAVMGVELTPLFLVGQERWWSDAVFPCIH